jgi:hypothetical protein
MEAIPVISNNRIINNLANLVGGGIRWVSDFIGGPVISNNVIAENTAYAVGGGISITSDSVAVIANNTICFNTGAYQGGGIAGFISNLYVVNANNTICFNTGAYQGGGIAGFISNLYVVNTILWGNISPTGPQIYGSANVTYSDIDGGWSGEGNIDMDPLFRDPQSGDFHLQDSLVCGDSLYSPCIDAGSPDILDSLIACHRGLGQARSDMGSYGGYIMGCDYVTGDVNGSDSYNGLDITYGVNFFKYGTPVSMAPLSPNARYAGFVPIGITAAMSTIAATTTGSISHTG